MILILIIEDFLIRYIVRMNWKNKKFTLIIQRNVYIVLRRQVHFMAYIFKITPNRRLNYYFALRVGKLIMLLIYEKTRLHI